jgi:hypothetical protein
MKKFSAKQIAISGLLLALNLAALISASFIPALSLTMQSCAGAIVYFAYVRFSRGTAIMIYAGSVILGLIIVPDKVELLFYILFLGLFALLKPVVEEFAAKRIGGTVNDPVIRPFARKSLRIVKRRRLVIAVAYIMKTVIAAGLIAVILILMTTFTGLQVGWDAGIIGGADAEVIIITGTKLTLGGLLFALTTVLAFYLYDYILWLVVAVLRKR